MVERNSSTQENLIRAVNEADLRVLLMVLVHMTGDIKWLDAPFTPKRDVRLIPDPDAGLSEVAQQQIRGAAIEVLSPGAKPTMNDPDETLMRKMMSTCLGEDVPLEYARLNREEMGLKSRFVEVLSGPGLNSVSQYTFLIVGAGVCGIALAVSLQKLGVPFRIVEKNSDVGGTWFLNRYPGCGVDTPNHAYSYSFGPKYRWSRYFSRREEVQSYVAEVADAFGLRAHISFQTKLKSSRWDDAQKCWVSELMSPEGSESVRTNFLVSAIGQLSDPSVPRIPGANDFKGEIFHSVAWPEELDIRRKNVAVIGTGATAMQLVPTIFKDAKSVVVYQRTPQWSRPIPGYSQPIGEGVQWLLKHVPFYAEWFRFNMFWRYGDGLLRYLRKDPKWEFPERSINSVNERHREEMVAYIHSELAARPDLIDKCIPTYPPYGKRILLDNGWYRAIQENTVELVTDPIKLINEHGIQDGNGRQRDADVIVYSTGFKVTEMAARLSISGVDGVALSDVWANDDPKAYLGLTVPGFPNFFCMLGPGSGPGHGGSVVFQAECQSRYITSCLAQMSQKGVDAVDIRQDVQDEYLKKFDAEHESLIWSHPGMSTYYRNAAGRVFSILPWRFVDYWALTHDADLNEFVQSRSSTQEKRVD